MKTIMTLIDKTQYDYLPSLPINFYSWPLDGITKASEKISFFYLQNAVETRLSDPLELGLFVTSKPCVTLNMTPQNSTKHTALKDYLLTHSHVK